MDGSTGYPLCRDFSTNRVLIEQKGIMFIVNLVLQRIRNFYLTGVYDDDYIRYFVKGEAHKWAKVKEGRYRLIASLSTVDQVVDALLFDNMLEAEVKASADTPIKNGRSFLYNGLDSMFNRCGWNSNTIVCFKDVSAWDWHVRAWQYELYYDTTVRLCNNWPQNPNNLYAALMRERLMCLMYAKCMTSDGNLYQQCIPGTVRSGSKITLSMNTRCSVGDKIDGAIMDHGKFTKDDWIIGIGDDTIEAKSIPDELTVKTASLQGRTLKHVHSARLGAEGENRPEWCSKNWKIGPHGRFVWWSVNYEKFCWNLINLEKPDEEKYAAEKLFGGCIEYYWKPEIFAKIWTELMNLKNAVNWQRSPAWFEYLHTGNESLGKTMKPEEQAELRCGDSWLLRKAEKLVTESLCPVQMRLECVELNPGPMCLTVGICSRCYRPLEIDCDCLSPSLGMFPIVAGPIAGLATAAGLTYALKDYKVTNENYIAKGFQWIVDHVPQAVKDFPDKLAHSEFNKWLHPREWQYLQAQDREKKRLEEMYKLAQQIKGKPKIARRAVQELGKMIHHLQPVVLDSKAMAVEPNPGPKKKAGKGGKVKKEMKKVANEVKSAVLTKVGKGPHTALFDRLMAHGHKKKISGHGRYRNGDEEIFVARTKLTNLSITSSNSQGNILMKLQLNPKWLANQVRVLAIEEQLWEKFSHIEGAIHVVPSVAYTSVTTLVHYIDKDPTDRDPTGSAAVDSALNHKGKDFALKEGGTCGFRLSGKFFVDASTTDTGADVRQQVPATYRLYIDVKPNANETVAVWATFKIHFKTRQLDTLDTPIGGTAMYIGSITANNIVATDPLGLGQTASAVAPQVPYASMNSPGAQFVIGTDGTGSVIGVVGDYRNSGAMLMLNVFASATTSASVAYESDGNMTLVDDDQSSASTAHVMSLKFILDATNQNTPFNYTFTGARVTTISSNGLVETQNAGVYPVWHYARLTGTFTAPLTAYTTLLLFKSSVGALVSPFLGRDALESKVYREVFDYKLKHDEITKLYEARMKEVLEGETQDKLRRKVQVLEELLDIANDRKDKKDQKLERVLRVSAQDDYDVELEDFAQVTPPPSLKAKVESKSYGLGLLRK